MGCNSSKRIKAAVPVTAADVYRPAPASFAIFDINSIEEPWLKNNKNEEEQKQQQEHQIEKHIVHVPAPLLEKLDKLELAPNGPHTWTEVSKVLEDLKRNLQAQNPNPKPEPVQSPLLNSLPSPAAKNPQQSKSLSFHTLEELDAKLSSNSIGLKKINDSNSKGTESKDPKPDGTIVPTESKGFNSLRENMFIVRDRMEREKEGKNMTGLDRRIGVKTRRNPLSQYPEKCPPGGDDSIVLYTTTLRGVRRTFEDCNRVRSVIEAYRVVMDERDVSLHGEFLTELKNLLGEDAIVPRLFVKGRYIGGVNEVVELNESCRLSELLDSVGRVRGLGGGVCEGCGGARFVPCLECGGSCKVLIENRKERCTKCNENGLVQCPICH